mgnify:CR=1 FL=1
MDKLKLKAWAVKLLEWFRKWLFLGSELAEPTRVHYIKCEKEFFSDVVGGYKSFEIRKNDRGYKVGDTLEMLEFKDGKNTGRMIRAEVTYLLEGYTGLEDGYCILGISVKKVDAEKNDIPGQMSIEDF